MQKKEKKIKEGWDGEAIILVVVAVAVKKTTIDCAK